MGSSLRAKLRMLDGNAAKPPKPSHGGLLIRTWRCDVADGFKTLSGTGLRRIGWKGHNLNYEKCLFLDTETTGLSHGAGTVAFLVGVGFAQGDVFTVEQYLMRDYADEPALLDALANRMDNFDFVCTFNGKTFDMPLLQTRYTMNRMMHRWRELDDLDLLPPSRRAWKLRLGSCKLSNLEERILNQPRTEDIPGSEVPTRYFEYLKTGDMNLLEDILLHNRQDIATLPILLVRLCEMYAEPETTGELRDVYSLGKALEGLGEIKEAKKAYRRAAVPVKRGNLNALAEENLSEIASWRLYLLSRRAGNVDEMLEILNQMLNRGQMVREVRLELSKVYEHRIHNYPMALKYAKLLSEKDSSAEIKRRIERIEKKIGK